MMRSIQVRRAVQGDYPNTHLPTKPLCFILIQEIYIAQDSIYDVLLIINKLK